MLSEAVKGVLGPPVGESGQGGQALACDRACSPQDVLARLPGMDTDQLRSVWRSVSTAEPPRVADNLLRQLIAYEVQVHHYGGLRPALQRELNRAAQRLGPANRRPAMRPGTRLIREWRGRTINVQVRERDFVWEERSYRSLSQIACEVTGARWSGPRFFGLAGHG